MKFVTDKKKINKLAFQYMEGSDGYPEKTDCRHCHKAKAKIIGVLDDEAGEELCKLPHPEDMENWPHDSCSIAIYMCGQCLQVTGLFTQA